MNEQEYFFMGKTLVLAEKPSVGKELARVLGCHQGENGYLEGPRYVVTWALGHLVTLADPEAYEKAWQKWDMDTLPMLPQNMKLVVIPESAKQFKIVQSQMKRNDISELVIATDAGREGELVARWIMQKAGWNRPTMRLWISSQTDRAIRDGFAHLRPAREYDALYRSAQARSEADWLVGLNVTRALTCRHNAQLSAGRVQTPTLALITQREEEIRSFRPRDFWTIRLKIGGFSVLWKDSRGQSRIFDENQARTLAKSFEGRQGVITQVNKQYKQVPPPPAYDLTELQRDANRKYAYSAKETLNLMQSLYERHKLLTCPRTDSRYSSDDVVPTLPERLRSVMVGEYADLARQIIRTKPLQTRYLVNNAKVTDHHAIIPTEEQPELWRLSGPEKNIYDLVVRRFLPKEQPSGSRAGKLPMIRATPWMRMREKKPTVRIFRSLRAGRGCRWKPSRLSPEKPHLRQDIRRLRCSPRWNILRWRTRRWRRHLRRQADWALRLRVRISLRNCFQVFILSEGEKNWYRRPKGFSWSNWYRKNSGLRY